MRIALIAALACSFAACHTTAPDVVDPLLVAEDRRIAAAPALDAALSASDAARRERAVVALGRIQDADSLPALVTASDDATRGVRLAALFALGQLGLADGARAAPEAVRVCRATLDADDPEIVAAAIEALGKLAPAETEAYVLPLGEHADPRVRAAVADALFRRRFVPTWRGESEAPPALGPRSIAWIARALGDPALEVRRAAAHACSRFGEPVAVDALLDGIADDDELVRLWAARCLARRAPDAPGGPSLDALGNAARDASPRVRVEAIGGLAAHDARSRIPQDAAVDASFHVRAAWARTQAETGVRDASTESALEKLLDDRRLSVRAAALDALAARRGGAALELVVSWLGRDEPHDRLAALAASTRLGADATEILFEYSPADTPERVARLDALAEIGAPARRLDPVLDEALAADDLALRGTAVARIGAGDPARRVARLVATYRDSGGEPWIELRESVVDAIAALPIDDESDASRSGIAELLRLAAAADPAGSVRARASRVLVARGESPPEPAGEPPPASRLLAVVSRAQSGPAAPPPRVALETDRGTMTIELFAADAPLHVALFIELVESGFYDGLSWHRVVPNFVVQGGDPRGDGWGGAGTTLRDEINRRPYERGSVGMPKAGKDSGGGQLFVTHLPTPHLDGNYTVFGRVVDGLEVIDRIDRGDRIVRARRLD